MLKLLTEKLIEVLRGVAPVVVLVTTLQLLLVHAPVELYVQFLIGSVLLILGLAIFFVGLEIGILPMGHAVGAELPKKGSFLLILGVAFALGFATTVAEPDVLVLADQVDAASEGAISGQAVLYVIAFGLAIFTALALARVVFGFSIVILLTVAFGTMVVLAFFTPPDFVPLAFDAGGVTTGVVAAPVVIALALGVSAVIAGRSPITDGFGLLGIASVGAIIAVMLMGILS
ncbi:MAG: DUF1538 domain-containing protein [Bauldia sp.]|nr:DUF1538 domain-containing protein [Bauldia sp.]